LPSSKNNVYTFNSNPKKQKEPKNPRIFISSSGDNDKPEKEKE